MATSAAARQGQGAGEARLSGSRSSKDRIAVMALLWLALVFAGGASRYDEPQQLAVRLAAIAAIAATLWRLDRAPLQANRRWLFAVAAVYALVLVQLLPLPPELWAQLPGRAAYAEIARTAGAVGWRPLSLTPDLTLNALFALLPATAAGLAALHLDSGGRRAVWVWVVAAALFSAILGLAQLAAGGNALRFYRETSLDSAVGVFANRNHQAAFLACSMPLAGALAGLQLRSRLNVWAAALALLAAATLMLLALVATGSRAGLVLGLIGTVGAIWCFRATGAAVVRPERRFRVLAAGLVAATLAAIALVAVRVGLVDRLVLTDPAAESRIEMIDPLLRTAEAFMPVGSGFGSFDSVYRRFEPDSLLSTIYMNHAHNEPLQLAIEGGVPALFLLALFLVWWFWTAVKVSRSDLSSARRSIGRAAVVITAMLMLASLVEYPLRTPLLSALFMIACVEMMRTVSVDDRRRNAAQPAGAGRG